MKHSRTPACRYAHIATIRWQLHCFRGSRRLLDATRMRFVMFAGQTDYANMRTLRTWSVSFHAARRYKDPLFWKRSYFEPNNLSRTDMFKCWRHLRPRTRSTRPWRILGQQSYNAQRDKRTIATWYYIFTHISRRGIEKFVTSLAGSPDGGCPV